jgi:hypothetical protein
MSNDETVNTRNEEVQRSKRDSTASGTSEQQELGTTEQQETYLLDGRDILRSSVGLGLRNQKWIRLFLVSLAIDVCLTIGLWYNIHTTSVDTMQQQYSTCVSGNGARSDNRHLWDELITLSHVSNPSKNLVTFEKYLKDATAPRDCSKYK